MELYPTSRRVRRFSEILTGRDRSIHKNQSIATSEMASPNSFEGWTYETNSAGSRAGTHSSTDSSLTLDFQDRVDGRFSKTFRLTPGQRYRATVHAIGENIESPSERAIGGNISLWNTWTYSTEFNKGTGSFNGDLCLPFRAPRDGTVIIAVRLGFYYSEAKGKITFSDFRLEADHQLVNYGTGQVRISMKPEDVDGHIDPELIVRLSERLSSVYFAMAWLYGSVPFGGETIFYESTEGITAWAYAGNPVQWRRSACVQYFEGVQKADNACFGAIHEMGHNFEQTKLSDMNREMMANFAMCYAVEALGLRVIFEGETMVGRELQEGFYRRCYEKSIAKGQYSHDGLLYCLLRIKDLIGWKPFEVVMRKLIENKPETAPPTATLDMWMTMLTEVAGTDVRKSFIGDEYAFLMSQEHL
jgi:hypothetical protein